MSAAGIFDALFVNQLFRTNTQGQTVYYPHGVTGRGYLVPPDREAGLRSGLRWLVLVALVGVNLLVVIIPRLIEAWLGYQIALPWFIGGALIIGVASVWAIIRCLSRLGAGLETAGPG